MTFLLGTLLVKPRLACLLVVCSILPYPGAVSSSVVYVRWVPSHIVADVHAHNTPVFFR
ncbi:hypothetical protein Esi_0148_0005 [Ectocarpus siliculosus]|uniref:Uncharacterized protein n=1 Tax=Ectocarpus siliculosus TaxID=2880 RepID=D8LFB9_ECTSI|nr:hypothetical protein Esi_0148_0005 [Ectocarpus siliculosus]|eukprot:CBN75579.1 hypothetical protein Esi_0148_0005 [Ectocarpus siliculosus]